jgi:hypothetical protein
MVFGGLFRILRHAQPLYIVDDGIWVRLSSQHPPVARRIASLTGLFRSLAYDICAPKGLRRPGNLHSQAKAFRFVLCELLCYLRFLRSNKEDDLTCAPVLREMAGDIVKEATGLQQRPRHLQAAPVFEEAFKWVFAPPCAMSSDRVVPLKPVTWADSDIIINGRGFRQSSSGSTSLSTAIDQLEKAVTAIHKTRTGNEDPSSTLLEKMDHIISGLKPTHKKLYKLVYQDQILNQLQYGEGHFLFVHGPIWTRIRQSHMYVCLPIIGGSRAEWLDVSPIVSKNPEEFWMSSGFGLQRGLCMGPRWQYQHLLSPTKFTDAEAVVQWLAAGVHLSTGTKRLHCRAREIRLADHL